MAHSKIMAYPMIFEEINDESGHYFLTSAPDLQGVTTDGPTLAEAILHAQDALEITLLSMVKDLNQTLPAPSSIESIQQEYQKKNNVFINLIAVDLNEAEKKSLKIVKNGQLFEARDYQDNVIFAAKSEENLSEMSDNYKLSYIWKFKKSN